MPETPPATCHTVVAISSAQYRDNAIAALGILSHQTGLTFEVGEGATLRIVEVTPIPVAGYEHMNAVFNGDVIYIQAHEFSPRYATTMILHELGHWVRMEHNHRKGSVMNLTAWPQPSKFSRADVREAKSLTSYCR